MTELGAFTLIANGLTLALALGILLILLWHDRQKRAIQFCAVFLILVITWNIGALLVQASALINVGRVVGSFATGLMEVGFAGSGVALYVLITFLVGTHTAQFRTMAFLSLLIVAGYRGFLIVNDLTPSAVTDTAIRIVRSDALSLVFFIIYNALTLYLIGQYRRKLRSELTFTGCIVFVIGQALAFLNPEIAIAALSTNVSAVGCLLVSLSILKQEVIAPLAERNTQVETLHKVSLAITSRLSLDMVLNEIAIQAADWLEADGVGLFLHDHDQLELVTVHNLPPEVLGHRLQAGIGMVGKAAATKKSLFVENYGRDWKADADLPLAKETFGSAICTPLVYDHQVTGVLMVVAGRQGRMFQQGDVYLLELLSAQAAVAIAHSRFFNEQKVLTRQVEEAHRQLETLLVSTENPVIAVNRQFKLIFANPAARKLFALSGVSDQQSIFELLPRGVFPPRLRDALYDVRHKKVHVYEIFFGERWFLCHLAGMGYPRSDGWVTVLNDVTELKELDRVKSEVVRMVSHDLKNPLMGAMLYLDILRESSTPMLTEPINVIEQQLERMNRIIRGVLDLEKIRNVGPGTELVEANQLVLSAVAELKRLAFDKEILLRSTLAEDALYFVGDAEQFERALVNLVENAVKFSRPGSEVVVEVRRQGQEILFRVQDHGIGIPLALQGQVFERFFRGRQKGIEHVSGSGLGLSIVKTVVESHHGRVWLESVEEKGTTFFVTLPLARRIQQREENFA